MSEHKTVRDWRMAYGEVAFNAYRSHRGGRAHNGEPIPSWDEVSDDIRDAWIFAGLQAADLRAPE